MGQEKWGEDSEARKVGREKCDAKSGGKKSGERVGCEKKSGGKKSVAKVGRVKWGTKRGGKKSGGEKSVVKVGRE